MRCARGRGGEWKLSKNGRAATNVTRVQYQHLNKQYNLHVGGVCIVVYRTYSNILELTSDYFDFNIVPGRLPLYSRILLEHYTSKKIAAPS